MRQKLASFRSCRAPGLTPTPFRRGRSTRKTSQDFGFDGRARRNGLSSKFSETRFPSLARPHGLSSEQQLNCAKRPLTSKKSLNCILKTRGAECGNPQLAFEMAASLTTLICRLSHPSSLIHVLPILNDAIRSLGEPPFVLSRFFQRDDGEVFHPRDRLMPP